MLLSNSDSLVSLSVIVTAFRTNLMENLPWGLLWTKGGLQFSELIFFDVYEYPSIRIVNYVRDDFILVVALCFRLLSTEHVGLDLPRNDTALTRPTASS